MGLFTKDIKTMNDLFVHQLQDIYYAEQQLTKALPKMADKATDPQLKQGFLTHLEETKQHVKRLEEVFKMHGAKVKAVDCPAIDGIIEEADETAGEVADKAVFFSDDQSCSYRTARVRGTITHRLRCWRSWRNPRRAPRSSDCQRQHRGDPCHRWPRYGRVLD